MCIPISTLLFFNFLKDSASSKSLASSGSIVNVSVFLKSFLLMLETFFFDILSASFKTSFEKK